jgi:hypothetical protein
MLLQGQVGPSVQADGTLPSLRLGKSAEGVIQQLHGKYYEQNYRGNMYSFGLSNTALVTQNAIATNVNSSAQPVIGLYNPSTSSVNLVILQLFLVETTIANTAVAPGGFMWMYSAGNPGVSTGSTPVNCKTLTAAGSSGKAFAVSTALTGLTNNLSVLRATSIGGVNAAGPATAITQPQGIGFELVEGSIIVPPGGVIAVMNQLSTTTISVSVGLMWEEVAV